MPQSSPRYEILGTKGFQERFDKYPKRSRKKISDAIMQKLTSNPILNSSPITISSTGMRKLRVNAPDVGGGVRVEFFVCKHCKDNGHLNQNKCVDCDDNRYYHVVLVDVPPRKSAYKKHRIW